MSNYCLMSDSPYRQSVARNSERSSIEQESCYQSKQKCKCTVNAETKTISTLHSESPTSKQTMMNRSTAFSTSDRIWKAVVTGRERRREGGRDRAYRRIWCSVLACVWDRLNFQTIYQLTNFAGRRRFFPRCYGHSHSPSSSGAASPSRWHASYQASIETAERCPLLRLTKIRSFVMAFAMVAAARFCHCESRQITAKLDRMLNRHVCKVQVDKWANIRLNQREQLKSDLESLLVPDSFITHRPGMPLNNEIDYFPGRYLSADVSSFTALEC